MTARKIFFFYPYYWPHYKAGGPVQSLFNFSAAFNTGASLYTISLTRDIDGSAPLLPVIPSAWNKGPNQENIFFVKRLSLLTAFRLVKEVHPDVLYINGLFNIRSTLIGIFCSKVLGIKAVIAPRGMLQPWALKRSPTRKKMALGFLRMVLSNQEQWHATDEQERHDIHTHFGTRQSVHVASNVPRPVSNFLPLQFPDEEKKVRLVFLSLINKNKNLHLVIEAVNALSPHFSLDIFGPPADPQYWEFCKTKIKEDGAINYKGGVAPWDVPSILKCYHFLVLPTEGENFGHAIFDSLASGVPVLISRKTPWKDIEQKGAGLYIDSLEVTTLIALLDTIRKMADDEYQRMRAKGHAYAVNYWAEGRFTKDYEFLIASL